mgnify:CR=1 FL=1
MRRVYFVDNPGREPRILVVNNLARSSVGYDRSFVYWGASDGYAADRRTEVPSWCAVDALAADLDDDGWAELVIGNYANTLKKYKDSTEIVIAESTIPVKGSLSIKDQTAAYRWSVEINDKQVILKRNQHGIMLLVR